MIYISQLLPTATLKELTETYPVGLEVISFSIGYILDDLEKYIKDYQEEFKAFSKDTPITFHGPFLDLLPGSCDERIKKLAKERFEAGYKAAQAFGINQIVFHTGYIPNTYPDKYWLENVINFWRTFIEDKIDTCTFYIENVLDVDYKLLKALVEAINHPNFKVCLDIGHAQAYSKIAVQKWIEGLGEHIGYVHLHNNDGTRDGHRGLGEGIIPIKEVLEQLQEKAPNAHWSLEISNETELKDSLEWLSIQGFLKG